MLEILENIAIRELLWLAFALVLGVLTLNVFSKLPRLTAVGLEWLSTKVVVSKNEKVEGIKRRVIDLIGQKVLWAEQTLVEELKERAADGRLTKEELIEALADVKNQVITRVKRDATAQGLWDAAQQVFMGNEVDLVRWVEETTEATVGKLPPSGLQSFTPDGMPPALEVPAIAEELAQVG